MLYRTDAAYRRITLPAILIIGMMIAGARSLPAQTEIAKVQASDIQAEDFFGRSVAISGDWAIVGAPAEDSGGDLAGAAYFFKHDGEGVWQEIAKVQASDRRAGEQFGWAVAISGDKSIIGANFADADASNVGAAYLFELEAGDSWQEVAKVYASDMADSDHFGDAVAIDGDRAIVGARFKDIGGDADGEAYFFERDDNGNWLEVTRTQGHDTQPHDFFGSAVAIQGDWALVAASEESSGGDDAGAVYCFERADNGQWNEMAKIQAGDREPLDFFGAAVALAGDWAVIGAPGEDSGGSAAGACYFFAHDGNGVWLEVDKVLANDLQNGSGFGTSVTLWGHRALVGANESSTSGPDPGSAYFLELDDDGHWREVAKVQAHDHDPYDGFGGSVSLSASHAIVGAPWVDDGGNQAGAAYLFHWAEGTAVAPSASALGRTANYPNPFNPTTRILFTLPATTATTMSVLDASGRILRTLLRAQLMEAGTHEVIWNGRDNAGNVLPSGVYLYRLEMGSRTESGTMTLLK